MSAAQIPVGYLVSLETEHYSFEAYGHDEKHAMETMKRTLRAHGKQCGLPKNWFKLYSDSFHVRPFLPGSGARDGSLIAW